MERCGPECLPPEPPPSGGRGPTSRWAGRHTTGPRACPLRVPPANPGPAPHSSLQCSGTSQGPSRTLRGAQLSTAGLPQPGHCVTGQQPVTSRCLPGQQPRPRSALLSRHRSGGPAQGADGGCARTSTLVGQHSTARLSMILASSGSSSSTAAFHKRTELGTCSRAEKVKRESWSQTRGRESRAAVPADAAARRHRVSPGRRVGLQTGPSYVSSQVWIPLRATHHLCSH